MYTKRLFLPSLAFISIAIGISCNKDDDDKDSNKDILTKGQWKVSAMTVSPAVDIDDDGDLDTDLYALYEPCEKDDYFVFRSDGKMERNEGSSKCDPVDPQSELVDWSFTNDEKEIIIDGDIGTIQELTSSRFRISGVPYTMTSTIEITFTK